MAPPEDSAHACSENESRVNEISNLKKTETHDIITHKSDKVIYGKNYYGRAFYNFARVTGEVSRSFEEKWENPDLLLRDGRSKDRGINQTYGHRGNEFDQMYEAIRIEEDRINCNPSKDFLEVKQATLPENDQILHPVYDTIRPDDPPSPHDETENGEKREAKSSVETEEQVSDDSNKTPNCIPQIKSDEECRDVLGSQDTQRSFSEDFSDEEETDEKLVIQYESLSSGAVLPASSPFRVLTPKPTQEEESEVSQEIGDIFGDEDESGDDEVQGLFYPKIAEESNPCGNTATTSFLEGEEHFGDHQVYRIQGPTKTASLGLAEPSLQAQNEAEESAVQRDRQLTILMKHSARRDDNIPHALPCIQAEFDGGISQRPKRSGAAPNIPPVRSAGKHGSGTSASLSPADSRSLTANRGGSPPQISPYLVQILRDENSPTPGNLKNLNLVLNPTNGSQSFPTEEQPFGGKKPIQRIVPTLEWIVTMKFVKITKNVHEAFENLTKIAKLVVGDCRNESSKVKFLKEVAGVPLVGRHGGVGKAQKISESIDRDITTGKRQEVQPKFLTSTSTASRSQWAQKNTTITYGERNSVPTRRLRRYEFIIRIIHENPDDQYRNRNQWDGTAAVEEPGATYFITITGISETQIQSRIKSLQENFDSLFPSYRRWRYGKNAAKRVELYAINRGRNEVRFQRVCNIDVRGKDHGQCHVHESKIQEVPQFVEVMQPRPGIISDMANDPPGQQSVYIPPGDHRKEAYRLSTFESFPKQTPINVPELAKYGFFYTGFYDRVKCYCCGRTVEHWAAGDIASDKRWHKQDCLLARGMGSDNIPIDGRFSSALFAGLSGGASSTSTPQPMEVGPTQTQTYNAPRGVGVSDLTRSGGTFQMLPNTTFVIGPTSVQSHQAPLGPTTNNPPARNPPRQWRMANVISADHKRYLTNLYLNREIDRLASFCRWPTGRPNVAPVALARAGFFYLGDMDRTQCFSCGGVLRNWSADDDAMVEHRTHFPNCRIVAGVERRNVPIPEHAETPMDLAEKYPCRFPMNPHMRSEPSRLATFDRRWPADRTRAQPQEIAEAGFFFLGERDRVKCWYCNGGLQNWEYDDVPWIEHAKWFPTCQFLLAKQGQLFVYRYLSLSPHLPRPTIGRQDGASVDPSTATVHASRDQSSSTQDVPPPAASRVRAPSPPPAIIDPQEELRRRRERVEKELKENDMAKVVLAMGYEENLVRRTLMDRLESGCAHDANSIYEGTAALLEAVLEKEGELEREREEEQATSIKLPTISSTYSGLTAGSMDTSPSGPPSGVHQVSGFDHDDDDENRDLYSSIVEGPSSGAVGGVTGGHTGNGAEIKHIWKDIPDDQESMKEFIEQKKEERLCKICFTETADMVFIPCSHMVCCMTCTEAIRHCPVCRTKIEKAIKTYVK